MRSFSFGEILVIVLLLVLLFGGKQLPQLAKSIGQSMKEFKKGMKGDQDDPPGKS